MSPATVPHEGGGSEPRSIWRERDFRLVLAGGFVNETGDWLLAVALPVFVFTQTHSGRNTAAVFVTELVIGVALGPYGGSLADRWDLRRTIVATNALQAVTLLPLLAVTGNRLWPAFVVIAAQSCLKQVNDPASFALVPRVVSPTQIVPANAAGSAGSSLARLVGSPLGGIAVAIGGLTTVVVVDALTFGAVAAATMFVRTPTPSLHGRDRRGSGVGAGIRDLIREPGCVGYVAVQALAQLAFAMFPVLFIVFVVEELHGGGTQVGLIRGTAAFGGIVASLAVGRSAKRARPTTLMAVGYAGLGVVAVVFVNAPTLTRALWVYLVLFALTGLPNMTSQIGASSTGQLICPPETLGRLSGIVSATGAVGAAVGSIGIGLLVDHFPVRVLFDVQAVLYVMCGLLTLLAVIRPRRHRPVVRDHITADGHLEGSPP